MGMKTLPFTLVFVFLRVYISLEMQNSWNHDIYARIEVTRHLKTLYAPFLLARRVLSGNIVNAAASLIDMVLERNIAV